MLCCGKQHPEEDVLLADRNIKQNVSEDREEPGTDVHQEPKTSSKRMLLWYATGLLATCFASASLGFVQALNKTVPHSELNGLRFTAQLVFSGLLIVTTGNCEVRVARQDIIWVICNAVLLTASSYCHFGAAYYLPVGYVTGLSIALQLIMSHVLNLLITRQLKWKELIATMLCLLGIIFVLQPTFIFSQIVHQGTNISMNETLHDLWPC